MHIKKTGLFSEEVKSLLGSTVENNLEIETPLQFYVIPTTQQELQKEEKFKSDKKYFNTSTKFQRKSRPIRNYQLDKFRKHHNELIDEKLSGSTQDTVWYPPAFVSSTRPHAGNLSYYSSTNLKSEHSNRITTPSNYDYNFPRFRYTSTQTAIEHPYTLSSALPENRVLKSRNLGSSTNFQTTDEPIKNISKLNEKLLAKNNNSAKIYVSHLGYPRNIKQATNLSEGVKVEKPFRRKWLSSRGREFLNARRNFLNGKNKNVDILPRSGNLWKERIIQSKMPEDIEKRLRARYHSTSIERIHNPSLTDENREKSQHTTGEDEVEAYSEEEGDSLEDIFEIFSSHVDDSNSDNRGLHRNIEVRHADAEVENLLRAEFNEDINNNFANIRQTTNDENNELLNIEKESMKTGFEIENIHENIRTVPVQNSTNEILFNGEKLAVKNLIPTKRNVASHNSDVYFDQSTPLHSKSGPPYDHYQLDTNIERPINSKHAHNHDNKHSIISPLFTYSSKVTTKHRSLPTSSHIYQQYGRHPTEKSSTRSSSYSTTERGDHLIV